MIVPDMGKPVQFMTVRVGRDAPAPAAVPPMGRVWRWR